MLKLKRNYTNFYDQDAMTTAAMAQYGAASAAGFQAQPAALFGSTELAAAAAAMSHEDAINAQYQEAMRPSKRRRQQSPMSDCDDGEQQQPAAQQAQQIAAPVQVAPAALLRAQQQQQQHQALLNQQRPRQSHFAPSDQLALESHSQLIERYREHRRVQKRIAQQQEQQMLMQQSCAAEAAMASQYAPQHAQSLLLNKQHQAGEASSSAASSSQQKRLFTEEEVKLLLKYREEQIRSEYDKILQERLQEQFNQFAQFNQDYISRQMRSSSDFSYIS